MSTTVSAAAVQSSSAHSRQTWRLAESRPDDPDDLPPFLEALQAQGSFFDGADALVLARAPGRLDLMGGIADYSGALVLQLPLAAATFVAAQPVAGPTITVWSGTAGQSGDEPLVEVPLAALLPGTNDDGTPDYTPVRERLTADPRRRWVAYVAGVVAVLAGECGLRPVRGARLLVHSGVPVGKGVSSSAALEVATMKALATLYDISLTGHALALLCQKVENLVAGAPCGVMDQMTAACGARDRLLPLVCQPARLGEPVALPDDVEVWGIDSGIRHAVSGSDYTSVRVGAFMGYRILADLAGLPITTNHAADGVAGADGAGHTVSVEDACWGGYLANVNPSEWTAQFAAQVPETMAGDAFLARYGGTTDRVTRVDAARTYAVRAPTAHPIHEHQRVRLFRALLMGHPLDDERLQLLGELMYQSHVSYSACGLGSDGTDRLVKLVRQAGPASGLYGAKITGGGCGGTVAILARRGAQANIERLRDQYAAETGRPATLIGGSSAGAEQFGVRLLTCN